MSPKITVHGGPSYAGDEPVRKNKPYGQMLAEIRAGKTTVPEPEPEPEPELAVDVLPVEPAETDAAGTAEDAPEAETAPKRKPGRPRKVTGTASAVLEGPVSHG